MAALPSRDEEYNEYIEKTRVAEFPQLAGTVYVDHAAMSPVPRRLVQEFSDDLAGCMYGNPHSNNRISFQTSDRIEAVRLKILSLMNADSGAFDVVFTANATSAIKLVLEGFQSLPEGFWFGYSWDCHTSVIGGREVARTSVCFTSRGEELQSMSLRESREDKGVGEGWGLIAFPAQSNMNGARHPKNWAEKLGNSGSWPDQTFVLLDAASCSNPCILDLGDGQRNPDFIVLSMSKIFGFPNLGALVVRRSAGRVLTRKKYFGGGTVETVNSFEEPWHIKKEGALHIQLEDGTVPVHSIVALDIAIETYQKIFRSFDWAAKHTSYLAENLYSSLQTLRHYNNEPVCRFYRDPGCSYSDQSSQGPIIALNILGPTGSVVPLSEVEKTAGIRDIILRTGTLCNPGGVALKLGLSSDDLKSAHEAGVRCDDEGKGVRDARRILNGMIRISFGPSNTTADVHRIHSWIKEFFLFGTKPLSTQIESSAGEARKVPGRTGNVYSITGLCVYPIKSCRGFKIPDGVRWKVCRDGLQWDREWCLVHKSTGVALSMKRYPQMALLKLSIDIDRSELEVEMENHDSFQVRKTEPANLPRLIRIRLSETQVTDPEGTAERPHIRTRVCGDYIHTGLYEDCAIEAFFSHALGVPCQLVRYSRDSESTKNHDGRYWRGRKPAHPAGDGRSPDPCKGDHPPGERSSHETKDAGGKIAIKFSNESPILLIFHESVRNLHRLLKENPDAAEIGEQPISSLEDRFRANIIISSVSPDHPARSDGACADIGVLSFVEDQAPFSGSSLVLQSGHNLSVLGPCRRCQIINVDPCTGLVHPRGEPLGTLMKVSRVGRPPERGQKPRDGTPPPQPPIPGALFGLHCALDTDSPHRSEAYLALGDQILGPS